MGLLDSLTGADAANDAAQASRNAANQAASLEFQNYMQTRQDQTPYRYVGNQALNVLARTYGLDPYAGQTAAPPVSQDVTAQIANMSGKQRKALNKAIKKLGYNPLLPQGSAATGASGGQYQIGNAVQGKGAPPTTSIYTDPTAPPPGQGTYDYFMASPDYQFRMDEGIKATDRSAAARGMLLSGAQNKAVQRYGSNLAAGEFGNWYNRMAGLAGTAQTATNQVQSAGSQYANNAGQRIQDAGDARASGYLANANIRNSLFNFGLNSVFGGR